MISLRKSTQYIIIILIFALSIYIGLRNSNLLKDTGKVIKTDTSKTDEMFQKELNYKKIRLVYYVDNIPETIAQINESLKHEETVTKFSETKSGHYTTLSEIPGTEFQQVIKNLREIDGLKEDIVKTEKPSVFDINVEDHISNKKLAKVQIQERMKSSRISQEESERLISQLDRVQTSIDSLNKLKSLDEHNVKNDLIYLTVIKNIRSSESTRNKVKTFVTTTILFLAIFTVGMIILYLLMVLLFKLITVLGIRTAKEGSSSYYNYRYYRKGHGRYRRPYSRSTKRINKSDKDKSKRRE